MDLLSFKFISKPFLQGMTKRKEDLEKRKATNAKAVAYIDKWIQDNFKSQGVKAMGGKWQDLSEATLMMRRKDGGGAKILEDTGRLKGTWKHLYTHNDARIQSEVEYAIVHDKGNPKHRVFGKKKSPLPQRKITPRKDQVWGDIKKIYKIFLGQVLK